MKTDQPPTIHLKDYAAPDYMIDHVALDFLLIPDATRVKTRIAFTRRDGAAADTPLRLDGEHLKLLSIAIDGVKIEDGSFTVDDRGLTVHGLPASFTLDTEVEINPAANTALEGLYISGGIFCTQCEAESFRRITYYPDRPDVMAPFHVRMTADKAAYPILLSNGNPIASGDNDDGTHWAEWDDPHKKPAYLFALVAGDLVGLKDTFTTMSGRPVDLGVWVRAEDSDKCDYAMDSLKRSMKWDEETYGREYDLDVFNIVAVNDFNFGAMENKGLNIFNSAVVLARPDTATDADYAAIESVVAHEYFHNWTGNRITCRDWFQICLKEGFTVYRDQGFSSDMREANDARIGDVIGLRGRQFAEDAGPLAHPPRPESYIKIDNFYTATVYEKGAEVVRMIRTLLGPDDFRKATDLYFARHDGQAETVESFVRAFEDASGKDLTQFRLWYSQAGTPYITARGEWHEAAQTYTLTLSQMTKPTPGQPNKKPHHIPVEMGLVGASGAGLPLRLEGDNVPDAPTNRVIELTDAKQSFTFTGIAERPVPSLFRGFSAPVILDDGLNAEDQRHLMAHDEDPFNRWEAGQAQARNILKDAIAIVAKDGTPQFDGDYVAALGAILNDDGLAPAFKARALTLPSEMDLGQRMDVIDPDAIHKARHGLNVAIATALHDDLMRVYAEMKTDGPFTPDADSAGKRALRIRCMGLLSSLPTDATNDLVYDHFTSATNMTDELAALAILANLETPHRQAALDAFYAKWKNEPLVTDKWFRVQAFSTRPGTVQEVEALTRHPAFTLKNPNRFRALIAAFSMGNQLRFNSADGSGYRIVADQLLALDKLNPVTAGRGMTAMESWKRFDEGRQAHARAALKAIIDTDGISENLYETASRILGE